MKVSLANALGTCFGVEDAINMAMTPEFGANLTIVGQLVHNPQINESLKKNGVSLVSNIDDIDKIKTKKVMITAHGAAQKTKDKLEGAGFTVYDASCPLVMRVHKTIQSMVTRGYFPVVIGQQDHVEVKGIVGDLKDYLVISGENDIKKIESGDIIYIVDKIKYDRRTNIKDAIQITSGIASTIFQLWYIYFIITGGVG